MTLTIDLTPEEETLLREEAARIGVDLARYARTRLGLTATPQREFDLKTFRSLPRAEQDRIMQAAAEDAAPLYETDLALPPHQRELTAFTVLDGDPLYNYADTEIIEGEAGARTETR